MPDKRVKIMYRYHYNLSIFYVLIEKYDGDTSQGKTYPSQSSLFTCENVKFATLIRCYYSEIT